MPTATVTPGYVFAPNELLTYAKLNSLGSPGVAISGTTSGAVTLQNYLRNGNFYGPTWLNTSAAGVSCPTSTETGNAQYWTVNPLGAAVTYIQSVATPNTHSLYTAAIKGNTSTTAVNISQTIPGDLSDTLNGNVSFSCWIWNATGTNMTPTLIISSANAYNNFSAVTQIASSNLATIVNNTWAFETATINLTGLSNVNNGLKISIQFPSGSLNNLINYVLVSQCALVPGTSFITYIDDFGLFSPLGYQPLYNPSNNAVLNGNFDVNQPQGTYSGLTGIGVSQTFDSWVVQTSGTLSVTHSQNTAASVPPSNVYNPFLKNSGLITVQTAEASLGAGDYLLVQNRIEGYRMGPLQGRPLSLQFWVRSTTTGTYWINLQNNNNTCAYITPYTINAASTWQQVLIQNIPAMLTSTGSWNFTTGIGLQITWALGLGATEQTVIGNAGQWLNLGVAYGTSSQVNLAASTLNTWEISGVQLEAGAVCTPLNYIDFAAQLQLLQRYYYKTFAYSTTPGSAATAPGYWTWTTIATANASGGGTYPTSMRAAGTPLYYNYSTGNNGTTVWDITSSSSIGSAQALTNVSEKNAPNLFFTSGGTAGHLIAGHVVNDVRL